LKLVFDDLDIDVGKEGFEQDSLNRQEFGQQLSNLVEAVDGSMVMALDGEWGTGKSTFLKMWCGAHKRDFGGTASAVYFDAFEHEFLDDPLTSLVAKLDRSIEDETKLAKIKNAAGKIAKPVMKLGLSLASAGITEAGGALVDAATATTTDLANKEIDEFWNATNSKIDAASQFRETLEKLASTDDGQEGKLVFVIDELDRCRPDYALQFLEVIKHFFAVKNVHFVLGVNLRSLGVSVVSRYGQDIGAEAYLRKFIHLTITLPAKPTSERQKSETITYLGELGNQLGIQHGVLGELEEQLELLCASTSVSLRDVQRIIARTLLLPKDFGNHFAGYKTVAITSLLMGVFAPDCLKKIEQNSLTIHDVGTFFGVAKDGQFEKPDRETAEHRVFVTFVVWARILQSCGQHPEDKEVTELTKGSFGNFSSDLYRESLPKYVRKITQTWSLSEGS